LQLLPVQETPIGWIGENMTMSLAFVIELHSEAVGLVVRDGNHYCFHSAVQRFGSLNGQSFRTPQDAEGHPLAGLGSERLIRYGAEFRYWPAWRCSLCEPNISDR
jgi:hypothetical protein